MKLSLLWDFFLVSGAQTVVTGTGSATLNRLTCTGTGASHHKFQATGTATLNKLSVTAGTGHASSKVTGSGTATLNRCTVTGHGQLPGSIPDDDPLGLVLASPFILPTVTGKGAVLLNWIEAPKGQGGIRPAPVPVYADGPGPTKLVFSGSGRASFGVVKVTEAEGVWVDDMEDLLTLLELV